MRASVALLFFVLCLPAAAPAETVVTDGNGQITAVNVSGDYLPIQTTIRIPRKGWGKLSSLADAKDIKRSNVDGRRTWTGRIEVAPGKNYRFEETLSEANGEVHLDYRVTAEADADIEGVFFWLDVPISTFAGGKCDLSKAGSPAASATMPAQQPAQRHFLHGDADTITMADAGKRTTLTAGFDRALPVVVQDTREWKGSVYSAFCQLAPSLKSGETTSLQVTLKLTAAADHSPAHLTIDANKVRYQLDGFGGDYCFNIESPVTQYTLANLNIAWARTEMSLFEWEPQNDNASPDEINWSYFESQDKPDSDLHREFLLAKQIQDKGVPYVISIWHLPEWLYADSGKSFAAGHRIVPPEKWPELLECIGSYLLYAKRKYGVEPNLFCFNEPNYGVRVYFSPEEHRDAIKRIGAYLEKLGLKMKMILGDATGPRGTYKYCLPAAADPEAMKYVGAVAFHSWGGGSPQDYEAWADLAARLKLPLLVTELGVDAGAWRTSAYDSFHYAMEEVRMYQELLLYARPQGTMQWEFTSDYSIVKVEKTADGKVKLIPTVRFNVVKQFCNLTPHHADVLTTSSDNAKVLVTAFAGTVEGIGPTGPQKVYTCHVANLGAGRPATITGLPAGVTRLRAVRTDETAGFEELPPVTVTNGAVKLNLDAQSLLTLTTMR